MWQGRTAVRGGLLLLLLTLCTRLHSRSAGMASGNCITDATTRGLLQQLAATGGGDGGSKGTGGSDGGGGGSGGNSGSSGGGGSFGDVPHPLRGATFAFAALLTGGLRAFAVCNSVWRVKVPEGMTTLDL